MGWHCSSFRSFTYDCRHRRELGMTTDELSSISDEQLEQDMTQMRRHHPQYGETLAFGHLRSKRYRVSQSRLRQAIRATDPINIALWWPGGITSRQPYSVPGPNSLWHIGKWSPVSSDIRINAYPPPTHTHTHAHMHMHTDTDTRAHSHTYNTR